MITTLRSIQYRLGFQKVAAILAIAAGLIFITLVLTDTAKSDTSRIIGTVLMLPIIIVSIFSLKRPSTPHQS